MDQRLLLVDSSIQKYESIVAAAQDTVTVVVFDRNVDTHASILQKIAEKNVAKFSLMGLVQHGDASAPDYRIVNAATPGLLSEALEENATMPSWNEVFEFMIALKTTYGIELIDLISCSLYSRPEWVTILNQMERLTNIQFRASSDPTGNLANGGNWVMESDNVNIQDVYFTEAIAEFQGLLMWQTFFRKNMDMVTATNKLSVPMVSASNPVNGTITSAIPCSIVGWGDATNGGTATGITNVVAVASTARAFAGIRSDGTVVAWGLSTQGGSVSGVTGLTNVRHIASTDNAFAALTGAGAVVAWGDSARGGNASSVSASLTSGVVAIASTGWAFAALKSNGTVVVWGDATNGGNSASVSSLTGVVSIASTGTAFAALRSDGTVFTWGASGSGGSTAGVTGLSNVSLIASNDVAFAALKNDGSVVAWGSSTQGGSITGLTDVVGIASSTWAFAALKSNGDVVAWGDAANGGSVSGLTNVVGIASNALAFAAITSTGSVITWGSSVNGGGTTGISGVYTIASTGASFAGIRTLNNEIVAWGNSADGGTTPPSLRDVTAVYATNFAFAAVTGAKTVVAWGDSARGGNASAVSARLVNVVAIASNYFAFAALAQPVPPVYNPIWGNIYPALSTYNSPISMNSVTAINNSGFVYLVGYTGVSGFAISGTAISKSGTSIDTIVVALNGSGNPVWGSLIPGAGDEYGYAIAVNNSGNVYVAGSTSSSGFRISGTSISGQKVTTTQESYVVAFNNSGIPIWGNILSGAGINVANGIAANDAGMVFTTGYSTPSSEDVYITAFDNTGVQTWTRTLSGVGSDRGLNIATNSSGYAYIVGRTNTSGFRISGTSIGIDSYNDTTTSRVFVAAYNNSGNPLWATIITGGTSTSTLGNGLAVTNSGVVYVVNSRDICALDQTGQTIWTRTISGIDISTAGTALCTNASGYVGFSATINGSNISISGTSISGRTTSSSDNMVVVFDSTGTAVWGDLIGGASQEFGTGIAMNNSGVLTFAGKTNSSTFIISGTRISGTTYSTTSGSVYTITYNYTPPSISASDRPYAPSLLPTISYNGAVRVSWVPNSSATSYTVSTSGASVSVDGSSTFATVGGLTNGITYTFSVNATNSNGNSASVTTTGRPNLLKTNFAMLQGGAAGESPTSICSDNEGRIYTTGITSSSGFRIIGAAGNTIASRTGTTFDGYAIIYNNSGAAIGGQTFTGTGLEYTTSMVPSKLGYNSGGVYVAGITTTDGFSVGFTTKSGSLPAYYFGRYTVNAVFGSLNSQFGVILDSVMTATPNNDVYPKLSTAQLSPTREIVYITGVTNVSGFRVNQNPISITKTNSNDDSFILGYEGSLSSFTNGIWGRLIPNCYITGNATNASGLLYVTGYTSTSGFRISGTAISGQKNNTSTNPFVVVYNTSGIPVWGDIRVYNSGSIIPRSIAVNSSGFVYIAGSTSIGLSGAKTNITQDPFVIAYNNSGNVIWSNVIPDTSAITGNSGTDMNIGVAVNNSGIVYVTGTTNRSGFTVASTTISGKTNGVSTCSYIVLYNGVTGAVLGGEFIGGTYAAGISGSDISVSDITVNATGTVYVACSTNISGITISGTPYVAEPTTSADHIIIGYEIPVAFLAPDAPTSVTATAGLSQAVVTWVAPTNTGGGSISSYTVTSSPGGFTATTANGSTTTATITGLTPGTAYTFTVSATTAGGTGAASSASNSVTPYTTPGAPTAVNATAGSSQATVSWNAPASNGGSAITSYTVTSSPGGFTATTANGSTTTATVTGLTPGTAYTFTVVATNAGGAGTASSASNSVTPYTTPGAPTGVTATAGSSQASVSWTAPASNGGNVISSYTVTSSPGGFTATTANGSTTTATVTGLTPGTAYTFTVRATNAGGAGTASVASNSVTPYTTPGAPTGVTATAGSSQASVSWTAPASNGFSAITSYTVTSNPGGFTATTANGTTTTATVTGLTPGTAYTFTVAATNIGGTGTASSASNSVTPYTTPGAPTGVTATAGSSQATVSWTAPASNGFSAIATYILTSSPSSGVNVVSGTSTTVTGLTPGTEYTFTARATNAAGTGPISSPSNSVTPYTTPDAPTAVVATGGIGQASISWAAPVSDGYSAITQYTVTASPGGQTTTSATTSVTMTGLTVGTAYTFTVTATNLAGTSTASTASAAVTPIGAPGTPTDIAVTQTGAGEITISWTPPVNTGGLPITSYIVSSDTGDYTTTVAGDQTTATLSGITTGTSYTFSVVATNAVSIGSRTAPSSSIFLITSPIGPVAIALDASVRVTWTLTSGDRSANTGYTITSNPGGFTTTVSGANTAEATIAGLTNGVSYIFTVVANTTSYGSSPTSMPTNAVIPNTVNIISAINESSTSQTSVADYIATQGSRPAPDVFLEAKGGMITEQDGLTLEQRTSVSVQYIESLRSTFGTDTIIVPSAKTLGTTFTARSDVMVDAPVVVFLPAYVAETAVVDLTNFDRNNKYVQIELPPTYSVVLTEGAFSKTLTYDGTTIALDGTPVGVDGKFRIGTTYEYTLAGIGSFLLLATPIIRRITGTGGMRILAHNFRMF